MAKIPVSITLVLILVIATTGFQRVIAQNQSQTSCGIQTGGVIHTQSDQQQFRTGGTEGQIAADENFQHHAKT